jgi:SNF2 family DNA or RNA helicase
MLMIKGAASYEEASELRKEVTGSTYNRRHSDRPNDQFAFAYPLSVEKCLEMRMMWGDKLKVHRDLGDWYRAAAKARNAQAARTSQTDATLVRVAAQYPKLNAWLKGDQRVTAAWIANAHRGGGLLADDVGTGKTAGVVAALIERGITGPTLIVCPKISVRAVWLKELRQHTDLPVYACWGTRKKREKTIAAFMADPAEFKVLVVVAEMLRIKAIRENGRITKFLGYEYPPLFDVTWSACVIDESHKVLGAMDVVRANLAGEGIKALTYAKDRLKLAVSATPFGKGGRTEALFGTLHWLWPDEFTSRWAWLRKYFEVIEDSVYIRGGGGATKTVQRVGEVIDEAALWADLGPRVLRRTMAEVSPEHRGLKHYYEVPCEMEGPQLAQYRAFAKDGELAVDGGIISSVGTLDYMTRCRQFANGLLRKEGGRVVYTGYSAKIERLMAELEKRPNSKVVIASQYNEFLDVVEARLHAEGYNTLRIDGKTTERQREAAMNAFQGDTHVNKKYRIFLLNSQAGGVSITLDAADELHELDEMFPPEANEQLFGRIFRRGRVHEVFFYLYRSLGTIDEQIGYKVADGQQKQARLLDGRRGLEYARTIAKYTEEM